MLRRGRVASVILSIPVLFLVTACVQAPTPTTSPSPTGGVAPVDELLTLSPVPLTLAVPVDLGDRAWVAPLTGPDIDVLGVDAAVQVQFRGAGETELMAGNLLWFSIQRFNQVMAMDDVPKGIEVGLSDGHVLFVQPALDMPFDPTSDDGVAFGTLVERVRDFRWYAMSDPARTLLRPCPVMDALPRTPVTDPMLQVIRQHYADKGLAPVRLLKTAAWVLDVHAYQAGTHACANPDGGNGGYSGAVPEGATEAVMVYVRHQPYAATGAASSFVTLARMPAVGWLVVGEGTGP